jgi:hypothetical protein
MEIFHYYFWIYSKNRIFGTNGYGHFTKLGHTNTDYMKLKPVL